MSDLLSALFGDQRKTEYTADFLPAGELLSRWNYGWCLDGRRSLTIKDSIKHAIIFGATGNFKSSGILIPSILKMRGRSSFVINDPSSELLLKTSGALLRAGYAIKVLNYGLPKLSEGYNPLVRIRNNSTSDIQKIAKMLVRNALGQNAKDPFWNLAAENLISICIQVIIRYTPKQYHSLFNVYFLISTLAHAPERIEKLLVHTDSHILNEYKAFLSYGDKTLSSIIATCRAALSIFGTDQSVSLVTSHDTIDVLSFHKQKIALFINTSVQDMRYYSLLTSIFLEQFFGELMMTLPSKKDLPVFFLLDEASSLYFPQLQITISNIRKYNSGILQIYQSASQLIDLYGPAVAKAITENSFARVHMPGVPISVALELETTLGKFEYEDEKKTRHVRPLMTANEIRELDQSIILCGNHPAIKTATVPYFEQFWKNLLTTIPPYQPTSILPFDTPPLIELPE